MAAIQRPDWSKLSSLDPELIRAFVAVVESGGFTAAARQLHRTQSTISLRIRTLEERLDTHLFLRNSRRLELSRDGENFLIHARRIIQVQNDAIIALKQTSSERGAVRFGLPEDYAELWLPDLLKSFYELRPGARLHVQCRMSLELLERLQAGELDVALVVRHGQQAGGRHLGRDDVVWAAHRDFRLDRDASVPLALFPETCCYRQRGLHALTTAERPYHVIYTSQSPTGIKIAVNHGAAVTMIDRCTLPGNWRVLGDEEGLPPLPPADLELHRSPGICDPLTDDLVSLIEAMVDERRRASIDAFA
ncbi:LysR family transcriptional regulator [Burkholderia ubonensis]|uniref:LysR family transcriptional regulator n=1 Tax=Burkholderia ubonensis TaxID=101571 RepID=UPI00075965E7|nr:LysR family transcriptional regulator [Burkholderia ubonensis]KVM03247.1 LysR family transcriptional regulator [Burkholderia ubonensis]KVM21022.1 LysR family transcriptional regulator [Burkholderia ubonensis]KVM45472.1 LysR family transcriptional regulator [Burkholderia ubonensis]KVM80801.1 LysR family transcriptional regulator [Burkholderia ubonensis]KVN88601.1 LysR family transcriptional regulator [Burkholderia ubonensis]